MQVLCNVGPTMNQLTFDFPNEIHLLDLHIYRKDPQFLVKWLTMPLPESFKHQSSPVSADQVIIFPQAKFQQEDWFKTFCYISLRNYSFC